jgi:hypothetical protein
MRKRDKAFRPDRIGDYFRVEWLPPGLVTVSGLVYNVGQHPGAVAAMERTSFYDAVYSPVLLLDEITADLDAETESRVPEALRHASRGRTVLSISRRVYESLGGRTVELLPQ